MATDNRTYEKLCNTDEKLFNKEELIRAVFQYTYDITRELIEWIDSPMLAQTTLAQITGAVEFVHQLTTEDANDTKGA